MIRSQDPGWTWDVFSWYRVGEFRARSVPLASEYGDPARLTWRHVDRTMLSAHDPRGTFVLDADASSTASIRSCRRGSADGRLGQVSLVTRAVPTCGRGCAGVRRGAVNSRV